MQRIGIGVLVALSFLPAAWPQASSTTVRGTVHDQRQAVIPEAKITLTNTATNVDRNTTSNDAGAFVFPGVFPGPYRLLVESAGMQKYEANLTVQAQQDAAVDVVLQVGQTATQVLVEDVTPMVTTENSTLAHTVERKRIEQLPVNGRGYQTFLNTVPGIDSTGIPQAYGMRTNTSTTIFDGAPVNEVWEGWDFGRAPGLDAVQEMHVETNNSSAKFTRPTTVLLTSRSGTNQFHGALFETNRNSGYGVARRRQDTFTKAPFLNRNEFGVSAGGPVYIPKLYDGAIRTFFFVAWEALRHGFLHDEPVQRAHRSDEERRLQRSGRHSRAPDPLYDPITTDSTTWARQQFPGEQDRPSRINPSRRLLSPRRCRICRTSTRCSIPT